MLTTQHRYHIRARPTGPCMGWGWDPRSRSRTFFFIIIIIFYFFFFFYLFFFFKNDILLSFQSRTEDLTQNVRSYALDWVYTSAMYTTLK